MTRMTMTTTDAEQFDDEFKPSDSLKKFMNDDGLIDLGGTLPPSYINNRTNVSSSGPSSSGGARSSSATEDKEFSDNAYRSIADTTGVSLGDAESDSYTSDYTSDYYDNEQGATDDQIVRRSFSKSRMILVDAERENNRLNHENNGFLSRRAGFLPLLRHHLNGSQKAKVQQEPQSKAEGAVTVTATVSATVSAAELELPQAFSAWELLVKKLPQMYRDQTLRQEMDLLEVLDVNLLGLGDDQLQRAATILSIFAHSYAHVSLDAVPKLPDGIQRPWEQVSFRLRRGGKPFMHYIDLVVYNWKLRDTTNDTTEMISDFRNLTVLDMELLVPTVGNQEEQIFYLTQVEILAKTSQIPNQITRAQDAVLNQNGDLLKAALLSILKDLKTVQNSIRNINPKATSATFVDPLVWAKTVAPLAVPLEKGPPGPSGTSSPFFHMFDSFINRSDFDSFLGEEGLAIRSHFPKNWQKFIAAIEEISVAAYIQESGRQDLQDLWSELIEVYFDEILGYHKRKVFGYITHAFKTGRNNTIGGFEGNTIVDGRSQVDIQLEASRMERLGGCPYSTKITSRSNFCPINKPDNMNSKVCPHKFFEVSDVVENNGVGGSEYYFVANQIVYDPTSFLDRHPGGKTLIALNSGRDVTNELTRVSHLTGRLKKRLDSFAVGVLKERKFQRQELQMLYESVADFGYYLSEIEAIFDLEVSFLKREITSADTDVKDISEYKRDLFSGTNVRFVNEFIPGMLKNLQKVGKQLSELEECPQDILLQSSFHKVIKELENSRLDEIVKSSYLGFDPEQSDIFQNARIPDTALKDHIHSRFMLLAKSKSAAINLLKILEQQELEQNETLDITYVQKMIDLFSSVADKLLTKDVQLPMSCSQNRMSVCSELPGRESFRKWHMRKSLSISLLQESLLQEIATTSPTP